MKKLNNNVYRSWIVGSSGEDGSEVGVKFVFVEMNDVIGRYKQVGGFIPRGSEGIAEFVEEDI